MRSTPGQRQSAWKHRSLFGVLLVLVAISFSRSGQAGHSEPAAEVSQIAAATVSPLSAVAPGAGVLPARTGCRHPGRRRDRQ